MDTWTEVINLYCKFLVHAVLPTFGEGKIQRSFFLVKMTFYGVFSPVKILNSRGQNTAFGSKFWDLLL